MSVGRVGGGGKRPGGVSGGKDAAPASKAEGGGFAEQVARTDGLASASGLVASAGATAAASTQLALAQVIAGQLKSGVLKSKEEATKKFVDEILREKLRVKSQKLTEKISEALQDDPRLQQALERLWAKAD